MQNIKFLKMIEMLTEMSKGKFVDFCDYKGTEEDIGIVYNSKKNNGRGYAVALDMQIDECHHDIVSYYHDYCQPLFEYTVCVLFNEDDGAPFIEIEGDGETITIDNGIWYFS